MTPRLLPALAVMTALVAAAPAAATTIDGPADVIAPGNTELDYDLDMAPDGTGAVAYVKKAGTKSEVYVSRRTGGAWGAPEQVSTANTGSNEVQVAAANGGRV